MKRSPIWCAAFALAWRQNRVAVEVLDRGEFVKTPPAEIARMCAVEADACEAAYLAAFPE